MCGRFTLTGIPDPFGEIFRLDEVPEIPPRYNIAPTQPIHVVSVSDGARRLHEVRWGLIPRWSKDPEGPPLINARSETVAEKPSFEESFRQRRCLVPADGYYEWKDLGGRKQPYYIHLPGMQPFAFAAVWDEWRAPVGSPIRSCAIITTDANEKTNDIHDRMPVILPRESYDGWLDPELTDPDVLVPLLTPWPSDQMELHPVSRAVNDVNNDGPDLVEAREEERPEQMGLF